jgi:hypothetical protein
VLASIRRRNVPYRNRFMKLAWNWAQFELLGYYVKKPPVAQGQPGRWSTTSLGRRTRRAASRLGKPAPKQESGWLKWKAKRPRRSTHRSPAQVQRLVPARPRHLASTPPPQATNVNHDRSSQTQLRFPKLAPGETLPWPTTAKAAPDALWPSPPSDRALLQAWRDRLILPKGRRPPLRRRPRRLAEAAPRPLQDPLGRNRSDSIGSLADFIDDSIEVDDAE